MTYSPSTSHFQMYVWSCMACTVLLCCKTLTFLCCILILIASFNMWDGCGFQVGQGGFSEVSDTHPGFLCQYRPHISTINRHFYRQSHQCKLRVLYGSLCQCKKWTSILRSETHLYQTKLEKRHRKRKQRFKTNHLDKGPTFLVSPVFFRF